MVTCSVIGWVNSFTVSDVWKVPFLFWQQINQELIWKCDIKFKYKRHSSSLDKAWMFIYSSGFRNLESGWRLDKQLASNAKSFAIAFALFLFSFSSCFLGKLTIGFYLCFYRLLLKTSVTSARLFLLNTLKKLRNKYSISCYLRCVWLMGFYVVSLFTR